MYNLVCKIHVREITDSFFLSYTTNSIIYDKFTNLASVDDDYRTSHHQNPNYLSSFSFQRSKKDQNSHTLESSYNFFKQSLQIYKMHHWKANKKLFPACSKFFCRFSHLRAKFYRTLINMVGPCSFLLCIFFPFVFYLFHFALAANSFCLTPCFPCLFYPFLSF